MSIKILIETLTQIPDLELLQELVQLIKKDKKIIIGDMKKFYQMFNTLYSISSGEASTNNLILVKTIELNILAFDLLLIPEIQLFWKTVCRSVIDLLGAQNSLKRQECRTLIKNYIFKTNNVEMILESLVEFGVSYQNQESTLVIIFSIKFAGKLLEQHANHLLVNRSPLTIQLVKSLIQQVITISKKDHQQLSRTATQFISRLFYLSIQRIEDVFQRIPQPYMDEIKKIWAKEQINFKLKQPEISYQIKYQHLPLINSKVFGELEPFVIKPIFYPDSPSAFKHSISQLKQAIFNKYQTLLPFINTIYKICLMVLQNNTQPIFKSCQILQILCHILETSGIANLVQLEKCVIILSQQLDSESVNYRKLLRKNLMKLNFLVSKSCLKVYTEQLSKSVEWVKIYELLVLIEHWIQNVNQGGPPTLCMVLELVVGKKLLKEDMGFIKIKEKCQEILILIIERYPGYRQDLENYLNEEEIGMVEDILESRKNGKTIPFGQKGKESEQIFMREYREERDRYIKHIAKY